MPTSVPAGTVTPLENVNGRNARRFTATGRKWEANQHLVIGVLGEIFQRTEAETIKSLGLSEKTVHLVHLVHSSFRPTFFVNRRVNLLAEGLDIFGIRK